MPVDAIRVEKIGLRASIRDKGKSLDTEYLRFSNKRIQECLLALDEWKTANTVLIYMSTGSEPETSRIIYTSLKEGKRVAIPRCLGSGIMEAREITSINGLRPNHFGILEPDETHSPISPEALDLIVAPCVAADKQLSRLGHGGGYFDRYLAKVRCAVVCLCREVFMVEEVPTGALDVRVSMVVTENGVYR